MLVSGLTAKSFTVTGLTLGVTYEFTIESQNSLGYSAPSNMVEILQALPPDTPSEPSVTNSGQDVIIDWSTPADNGAPITSY